MKLPNPQNAIIAPDKLINYLLNTMNFELYSEVVVQRDVPEEGLLAGDVGVVVERHDVPGLEPGYSVEFFDMLGNTFAVATLPASLLRAPAHTDRPAVRMELVAV